ncbi:MAG: DUF2461 domain-containing protein [Firmicutes bacterium]|nr:DUF2461 domain-containing protein [Bacillota bacterium]MDY4222089.1 DUF2461 domain-containing protein [Candidatus Faecousia sp.]MDY6160592.1 DUF2461 domain-containing protein [Candidatus Faecousia sp.]
MFTGFSPETIDFLWGIRMNNNRDWFLEHKKQYVDTLYQPMKELGAQLFEPFLQRQGDILKVSRIYRDARLHHPDPYKESLWASIRRDGEWWAENPTLFFEIRPDGVNYGFSLWHPKVAAMEAFRNRITAKPEEFLQMLHGVQDAVGMEVTAQCYKRPKEAPTPELQPYFTWKTDIDLIVHEDVGDAIFGPELGNRVGAFLQKLIPLYDYFNFITLG